MDANIYFEVQKFAGQRPQVFLALSGKPMKASDVGSQIGSCWEKVFSKGSGAGGATAFRKAVVSAVHRDDAGQRERV